VHKTRLTAILALLLALAASALTASRASAATPDAPWAATGTGTTTATSDGTSSDPVLNYSVAGSSGNWTFSATAKTTHLQAVGWHYKGYHAWFQVRVNIEKFVVRGGKEIVTEKLAGAGPVNCCTAPSGGFDYTGTTSFALQAGDVYGFRMSGSHFDSDRRLLGTLSLSVAGDSATQSAQARVEDLERQIKALMAKTSMTQQDMVDLQMLMRQRLDALEILSNLVDRSAAAQDAILANVR
jgi:hypothetical protein